MFCHLVKLETLDQGRTRYDAVHGTRLHGHIDITKGHKNRFCAERLYIIRLMSARGSEFHAFEVGHLSYGLL
ncbi:MAG: hypothetical protein A4E64_00115 [Syntrophorhabdus sp. PtaU1.Bin058]|nr:MAG: hypothetical protein A4E64_00115 [Syntrophorhabdus sp. PtaU1.Bin058]